jgi:uncharacterized repeat protein (TIGR01451 family)
MKKISILLLVLGMLFTASILNAQTTSGSTISNYATIDAANYAGVTVADFATNRVAVVAGATFIDISSDKNGLANPTATIFTNIIRNDGNSSATFQVMYVNVKSNMPASRGNWTITISDSAGNSAARGNLVAETRAPLGTLTNYITMTPDAAAADGDYFEVQVYVAVVAAGSATNAQYTGDNGVIYGGNLGITSNGSIVQSLKGQLHLFAPNIGTLTDSEPDQIAITTNSWVRGTVAGPQLHISKTISALRLDGNAITSVLPGCVIEYTIVVSNSGTAAATDPKITDIIDADTTYSNTVSVGGWSGPRIAGANVMYSNTTLGTQYGVNSSATVVFTVTVN